MLTQVGGGHVVEVGLAGDPAEVEHEDSQTVEVPRGQPADHVRQLLHYPGIAIFNAAVGWEFFRYPGMTRNRELTVTGLFRKTKTAFESGLKLH